MIIDLIKYGPFRISYLKMSPIDVFSNKPIIEHIMIEEDKNFFKALMEAVERLEKKGESS